METVCLTDFASKYRKDARNANNYVLRDRPVVIRCRNYTMSSNLDDYMREQVLLYVPFQNKAVDVLDNSRYKQLYRDNEELITDNCKEYNPADDDYVVAQLVEQQQLERQREDEAAAAAAATCDAVPRIDPQHEEADLIPYEDVTNLIKQASPDCALPGASVRTS